MISDLSVAIPIAVACLLISAFCSGTEVALFSIRRIEREQLARHGGLIAGQIVAMLGRPRRLIATVTVGNEAFNSVFAVLAYLVARDWYAPWPAFWIAIAVALPMIVLFTELTAKTLAAKSPLLWSRLCVLPLAAFELAVTPARWIVQGLAYAIMKPFGITPRPRHAHDLSEEEFRTLVDAGSAQGQVDARERRLIHRVFEFNDKNVGQVMTARERIFALSYELPAQRLVRELAARGFSRVPIYQKSLDNVRGILNAKDLVRTTAGQPLGRPLGELLHEPLFVPRTTPIKRLFLTFKQKKVHMAIVVSEYGKVLGLVTMDDLLAQIFGVLRDERAALQSSIPIGVVGAAGTAGRPAQQIDASGEVAGGEGGTAGASGAAIELDAVGAGELDGELDGDGDGVPRAGGGGDDGLVHRGDDRSGPAAQPGVLDPPPRASYAEDEVTPPAIDLAELTPPHGASLQRDPAASGPMPRARRLSSQADGEPVSGAVRRRTRTVTPPADDLAPAVAAAEHERVAREGKP